MKTSRFLMPLTNSTNSAPDLKVTHRNAGNFLPILVFLPCLAFLPGCASHQQNLDPLRARLADSNARRVKAEQQEAAYKQQSDQAHKEAFSGLSAPQKNQILTDKQVTKELETEGQMQVIEGIGRIVPNLFKRDTIIFE
jgi:hypothetical protein